MSEDLERIIHINGQMTDELCGEIAMKIDELSQKPDKKIIIIIDSEKGSIHGLMSIISSLQKSKCKLVTITTFASGCAAILFLYGNKRIITKVGKLTFREPSITLKHASNLTYSEVLNVFTPLYDAFNFFIETISIKTNLSIYEVESLIKFKDYIVNSDEAIKIRAATEIITDLSDFEATLD